MTRQDIEREVKDVFQREFEIENPDMDADLRETYEFDSIDAIELLLAIETFLETEITQEEKNKPSTSARSIRFAITLKISQRNEIFSPRHKS
ncbi:MAG TPA: phosphopantetheine-binding protein [Smithella sp.]|nr:phosphopantetheine-binding protein [Smithella sp.]